MTPDELVNLVEALVGGLTLEQARKGQGISKNLTDDEFILLVRFIAGERPPLPASTPIQYAQDRQQVTHVDLDFEDDDDGPTVLPGEFDGVTLP